MYDPTTAARLTELRALAVGRKLTRDEQAEVLRLLRGSRVAAATASATSRAAKAKASPEEALAKLSALFGPAGGAA